MSNPSFQPTSGGEECSDNVQRPNPPQEERKPESVVRPTTQQPPPPPHPPPSQLPSGQPTLQPQVQPVLQTSIIPSQPPTETVKPFTDTLAKALPLQKPPTMFTPRPLAPAPAPAPTITVPKMSTGPITNSPLPGQPMTTTISALPVPAAAMMKAVAQSTAQVPVTHHFASHVPRGIAAAANMSIPKTGAPTAILKPQTTGAATTSVQSILSSSLHTPFQHPSQRFSPAPLVPPVSGTPIHTCIALGVTRSSSPIVTSTTMQETHRPATHIQHALGMSLQPQPLPTPQPHLQPQTLTQVPTPQSQPQTQPQITQQPTTQLPTQPFLPQLRPQIQQDLTRSIPLSAQIAKYVSPASLPSNIPKPIISTAPSVTSVSTTLPNQPVMSVVNTSSTTIPPHTAPMATVSSVFTSASLPLGPMLAAVRSSSTPPTTTSAPTSQQSAPSSSIPVAKVYPRQQLPHSPRSQTEYTSEAHPTNILFAAAHRGSPNPAVASASVAAAASTNLPQSVVTTDNRTDRPMPTIPHTAPYTGAISPAYFYDPAIPGYHHMHPYATGVHAFTPISSSAVRQVGFNALPVSSAPQGSQSMAAAAVAAAAHAATVGAAPVRIGPMNLMPIDQRHPMATLPGTITTASSTEALDTSVAVSGMYALATSSGPLPSSNNLPNPSASPRPSILRKRTNEGLRKPVVSTPTGSQPGSPKTDSSQSTLSATNSPKLGDLLSASQPSSEVNVVDSSTNTSSAANNDVKIKQEPQTPSPTETALQVLASAHMIPSVQAVEVVGASPRKKPRKQQHIVGREDHDMVESNSTDEADETEHRLLSMPKKSERSKDDKKHTKDVKYIQYLKRPYKNLLDTYKQHWKPAHNHFHKYSEVRVKEDKKSSLQDIAGQRGVIQKANGWKIQHIASQLDDLANLEQNVFDKMKEIKDGMGPSKDTATTFLSDDEMTQVTELIQGNIQRCKLAMEQMSEAKSSMMKLLDHKQKVISLINKHGNKRSSKKKTSNT
ncbi:uncharacterized protein LOC144442384 [Glandiceps talaboti]